MHDIHEDRDKYLMEKSTLLKTTDIEYRKTNLET